MKGGGAGRRGTEKRGRCRKGKVGDGGGSRMLEESGAIKAERPSAPGRGQRGSPR